MGYAKKGDLVLVESGHTYATLGLTGAYTGYVSYSLAIVERATRDGRAVKGRWSNGTVRSVRGPKVVCYCLPAFGLTLEELESRIGEALEGATTLDEARAIFRELVNNSRGGE